MEEIIAEPSEAHHEAAAPPEGGGLSTIGTYMHEIGKVPLLKREEEISLSRNVRQRQEELRLRVLASPLAHREIRNWESLIEMNEMTPKELMPRGRRTGWELAGMRRRLKATARFLGKAERAARALRERLLRPKISPASRVRLERALERRRAAVTERVLTTLNPREAEVLRLRFGLDTERPYTLEELGQRYNITRERVRQIESKAIVKLRQSPVNVQLKDYL